MATITQHISSQFYNIKIDKPYGALSGTDSVTADYVIDKLSGLTIPTTTIDTNSFLKKSETNTMIGAGDINFVNGTNSLILNFNFL